MTNTNENIIDKIETRLQENKKSIKTYADLSKAVDFAARQNKTFMKETGTEENVEFIPVYLPNTGRWTAVFNLTKWLNRTGRGCYLGFFASKGFYTI
jgi:uncharacterized membrane protein